MVLTSFIGSKLRLYKLFFSTLVFKSENFQDYQPPIDNSSLDVASFSYLSKYWKIVLPNSSPLLIKDIAFRVVTGKHQTYQCFPISFLKLFFSIRNLHKSITR